VQPNGMLCRGTQAYPGANGLTTREALAKLVQEHPREAASLETYRQSHHGQGLAAHDAAQVAQAREARVYDLMWGGGR